MSTQDTVLLEWSYSPSNFFEEPIQIQRHDCSILIQDGRITATVAPSEYDNDHRKRDELHELVESRFMAVLLHTHRDYSLQKRGMSRLYPDGRRDVTLFANPCVTQTSCSTGEVVITDSNGNIVRDTRRERIDARKELAEQIEQLAPTDPLLKKLIASYQAAVKDPNNELVHLYEIRDALSSEFGKEKTACDTLGISKSQWGQLGKLANGTPLKQGRHRGDHITELRQATDKELSEARNISLCLIESYVKWKSTICSA